MNCCATPDGELSINHNSDWSGDVYVNAHRLHFGQFETFTAMLPGHAVLSGDYDRPEGCTLTERELRRATALAMCVHFSNRAVSAIERIWPIKDGK